ncbi:cupin domain-containing protein [Sphingobium limneticum]|jgi:50S ribosomal protein L16 3-hydroxylase|uniref:Cupin domain-containing protein n=1 Tax=Sphingobium limneticum TaxID=1007511 RepID=A0A5J5I5T1_9SPHN|nr:cupin domain-containing protein [Sphingobium limneticum]KAA9019655.1 cupin domain-containing protein [Sphingobium limneticum]KAA9032112.1 cupin domain-containing protein [Sphingobium limneticum]
MTFTDFDVDLFLRDYWQKKPLLIRNPWGRWVNPVEPDELAGLACEEGVESRLIGRADGRWTVEHGPMPEDRFGHMGAAPWTLLVQAVDMHVPDVAALIAPFRFVPNWRIDDVMVSYATDGGGVGAHYDQYDVFLIQGLGRRRWRVGKHCDADTPLLLQEDLRLLAEFEQTDEWVLEPGDILYVPPGIAHDGVAVGDDCMTYSVGFRAPARSELVEQFCAHIVGDMVDDDRYADPDLIVQANPGEIDAVALARLQAMVAQAVNDPAAFARWFGAYNSERKYPELDFRPEEPIAAEDVRELVEDGVALCRNPASRFAFVAQGEGGLTLFVDGQVYDCDGAAAVLAGQLCEADRLVIDPALIEDEAAVALIVTLFNEGSVSFDPED